MTGRPDSRERPDSRDRIKEALAASECRYRELYESAPNAYVTASVADGSITQFNEACVKLFGYSRETLRGMKIFEFYADTPEGKPKAKEVFQAYSSGQPVHGAELQMKRSDGSTFWGSLSVEPVTDERGEVVEGRGIITDISEQKRVQKALETSERRFRDMAECASDWFWETGPDHHYTYVSEKAPGTLNLEDASLIGPRLVGEVVDPGTQRWKRHIAGITARRPFRNFDERYRDVNGVVRKVRVSGTPFFNDNGAFLGYRGSSIDLTEIERMEAELLKSKGKLAEMLAIAPDAIVMIDQERNITMFNEGAENVFGYEAAEVVGQPLDLLIPEDLRQAHARHFARFATAPEVSRLMSLRAEITGLRKDGTTFPAEASISKLVAGGETLYTVLLHDISDRKGMERDLLRTKERAEVANRSKSDFLANMSHELRTPLNAVIGFSEVLMREMHGPLGSPKYLEYAQDIFDSGNHLLSVINDLLDLSKVESGHFELMDEDIDLLELVERSFLFVKSRAEKKGVRIENGVGPDLPLLRADPRVLKQIFANLLSNAVNFTERGGSVSVSASIDAKGRYCIEVADTGVGIPEDEFDMVLTPFEQARSAVRQKEGTGLGLPLAKSFVERHGGELELRSEVGKGTTIAISFPAARVIARSPETVVARAVR
ncbi:MAG: PAS domain S-box protein [Proteobacteria bacterium]|nr:PAS domain S-box protein [Pseudomonadota bacterium]